MSDMNSAGEEKTGSPKKKVSPARNAIGIVVLIAVVVFGWFQYSAKSGYNAAANALNGRIEDEDKGLVMVDEAERLIGKAPDGPGSDAEEGNRTFTKKTYSWPGLVKSYTLTAFYTKEANPYLHHFEADKKFAPESDAGASTPPGSTTARVRGKTPQVLKPGTRPALLPPTTPYGSEPATTKAPVPATTPSGSKPDTTTAPVPAKTPDGPQPDTTTAPAKAPK